MTRTRLGRDSVCEVLAVGGKRQQLRPQLHRVCVGFGSRAELLSHRTEFVRRAVSSGVLLEPEDRYFAGPHYPH